jgi:hypothetical protein
LNPRRQSPVPSIRLIFDSLRRRSLAFHVESVVEANTVEWSELTLIAIGNRGSVARTQKSF